MNSYLYLPSPTSFKTCDLIAKTAFEPWNVLPNPDEVQDASGNAGRLSRCERIRVQRVMRMLSVNRS
jgi:hypothetical protein